MAKFPVLLQARAHLRAKTQPGRSRQVRGAQESPPASSWEPLLAGHTCLTAVFMGFPVSWLYILKRSDPTQNWMGRWLWTQQMKAWHGDRSNLPMETKFPCQEMGISTLSSSACRLPFLWLVSSVSRQLPLPPPFSLSASAHRAWVFCSRTILSLLLPWM